MFFVGSVLNIVAYGSIEPFVAAGMLFLFGAVPLWTLALGGAHERKMYGRVFAVGWFMAGVAAIYANYLNDPMQLTRDAGWFFDLASGRASGESLEDLTVITEGAGAVMLWRSVYDALATVGFEKGRYLGVLVNVVAVAFSGVVAVKMARLVYGNAPSRLDRLVMLFSLCGLFWLFAAIHVRDGVVLLAVTTLAYVWTRYLATPGLRNLLLLSAATAIAFGAFGFLRTAFLFVPLAMLFAGLGSLLIFGKSRRNRGRLIVILAATCVVTAGVLYWGVQEELFRVLLDYSERYQEQSATESASRESLGMALIVNQALPVRLVLGSGYIYVFPVPFWSGLQLDTAYHLFKGFNAIFFYAVIPLVALSLLQLARHKAARTPALMFLLFLAVGFTLAIAGTSLESRHFGAFLAPLFVVALLPELTLRENRRAYKKLVLVFLSMMAMVHVAWLLLKV